MEIFLGPCLFGTQSCSLQFHFSSRLVLLFLQNWRRISLRRSGTSYKPLNIYAARIWSAPFKFSTREDMLTRRSLTHSVSAGAPIKKRSLSHMRIHTHIYRERKEAVEGVVDALSGLLLVRARFQYKKVKRLQRLLYLYFALPPRCRNHGYSLERLRRHSCPAKNTIHS